MVSLSNDNIEYKVQHKGLNQEHKSSYDYTNGAIIIIFKIFFFYKTLSLLKALISIWSVFIHSSKVFYLDLVSCYTWQHFM